MGLYDRDYARAGTGRDGGRRGSGLPIGLRFRLLSFVHWLVILNVAIFVTDALLNARGVVLPVHMGDRFIEGYTPQPGVPIVMKPPSQTPPTRFVELPIVDPQSQRVVGVRTYRWMPPLTAVGHFSTAKGFFGLEVWRLISFQFLHADLTHLLFNMMGLWFFGPLVEMNLKRRRRFAAYYLVCGIAGALLYLILNVLGGVLGLRLPGLLAVDIYTPLVGASAGVFGVLMAAARFASSEIMYLFFVLPMRVSTGAYLMFALSLGNLLMAGRNAGGDAAHVGGAIAGYFFIRNMHLLRDFFDVFGSGASTKSRIKPAAGKARPWMPPGREVSQADVDRILDKVREQGLHSLSEAEQATLKRATEAQQRRQ